MLYFNRNGVWFKIPLKHDGIYSHDLLEKQIHNSLLSLQNLKDRSPDLDQIRFEKKGEYVVSSVFGRDEIIINPMTAYIEESKENEKLHIKSEHSIPVPVFELHIPGYPYTIYNALKKFWVCLTQQWVPGVLLDSDTTSRTEAIVPETKIASNQWVFPLERIGTIDNGWDDGDYNNSQDLNDLWSPGASPYFARDKYFEIHSADGPWYYGGLYDYTLPTVYDIDFCTTWGGGGLPPGDPPPSERKTQMRTNDGKIQNILPYSAYTDSHVWPDDVSPYDYGDMGVYDLYYYDWVSVFRYHYFITCDIYREWYNITIEDYKEDSWSYLPHQKRSESVIQRHENQVVCLGNGTVICTGSYIYSKISDYNIVPSASSVSFYVDLNDSLVGEDVYWLADANIDDYSQWCCVYEVYDWGNTVNTQTVYSDGVGFDADQIRDVRGTFKYPYTYYVKAKTADSEKEHIIYSKDFSDWYEWPDRTAITEIYDFYGEPVYIISLYIWQGTDESDCLIKYAMIYKDELYLSDEFPPYGSLEYPDNLQCSIEDSYAEYGLVGKCIARACGLKTTTCFPPPCTNISSHA